MLQQLGRLLLVVAALAAVAGLVLIGLGRLGIGRLPGDLVFRKGDTTIVVPLATSLLLSVLITLVIWLLRTVFRR